MENSERKVHLNALCGENFKWQPKKVRHERHCKKCAKVDLKRKRTDNKLREKAMANLKVKKH